MCHHHRGQRKCCFGEESVAFCVSERSSKGWKDDINYQLGSHWWPWQDGFNGMESSLEKVEEGGTKHIGEMHCQVISLCVDIMDSACTNLDGRGYHCNGVCCTFIRQAAQWVCSHWHPYQHIQWCTALHVATATSLGDRKFLGPVNLFLKLNLFR